MLDLVIVNVPYVYATFPPLAGALLKSCVEEKGFTAKSVDVNLDFLHSDVCTDGIVSWMQKEDLYPNRREYNNFKKWVKSKAQEILDLKPRWIGISVFTKDSQMGAEEFVIALKDLDPDCKIVIGGQGADIARGQWNAQWYELMWDSGIVDSIILREGEKEIVNLLENNYSELVFAPQLTVEDLDQLPIPNFEDYNLEDYYYETSKSQIAVPITASKGCVRNCTFCDVGKFWPKFRSRQGENVAKEIIELNEKYGVEYFRFTDSLINGNVREFRNMNRYLESNLSNKIKYEGQFICRPAKHMPEEDFRLMSAAGCDMLQVGIESGSERVREHMRKKFSNDDIDHCAKMLAKYNIRQHWYIIVGYPNELESDYQDTLDLIDKYSYLGEQGLLEIIPTGVFQLLPGTPINSDDMMHELGIQTPDVMSGVTTYQWTSDIYKENTFEVRADRFLKLVDICREKGVLDHHEGLVSGHQKMVKLQLEKLRQ